MNYWLVKSEGECYSIDNLKRDCVSAKSGAVPWSGIRNHQARNFMRDGALGNGDKGMNIGDLVLFYHSGGNTSAPTGVYGIARVASAPHIDETALDPKDEHFDPRAVEYKKKGKEPLWVCVDMAFVKKFAEPVTLAEIKIDSAFSGMLLMQVGQRLSVMPVSEKHFKKIVAMGTNSAK